MQGGREGKVEEWQTDPADTKSCLCFNWLSDDLEAPWVGQQGPLDFEVPCPSLGVFLSPWAPLLEPTARTCPGSTPASKRPSARVPAVPSTVPTTRQAQKCCHGREEPQSQDSCLVWTFQGVFFIPQGTCERSQGEVAKKWGSHVSDPPQRHGSWSPSNPQEQRVGMGPSSALPTAQLGHSGFGHTPPWAHKASYDLQTCPQCQRPGWPPSLSSLPSQCQRRVAWPPSLLSQCQWVTILTALTVLTALDQSSRLFPQNNAYLELSQTYFYNLLQWITPNSIIYFILKPHAHKTNGTIAYCRWKMTPKDLTKDLFPIIYPNTASSETKQLEREI